MPEYGNCWKCGKEDVKLYIYACVDCRLEMDTKMWQTNV